MNRSCEEAVARNLGLCIHHHKSFFLNKISDDDKYVDEKTVGSENSGVGLKLAQNEELDTNQSTAFTTRNAEDHGVVYPSAEDIKINYLPLLTNEINDLPFEIDSRDIEVCDQKRYSLVGSIRIRKSDVEKMQENSEDWLNDNLVHLLLHW